MIVSPLFAAGYLDENVFVITDRASGQSAVVDPCFQQGTKALQGLDLRLILLTHGHFDHMSHAGILQETTGAKLLMLSTEAPLAAEPQLNLSAMFGTRLSLRADRLLEDGDKILLGQTEITVLHTPGHTAGSCCYLAGEHLFTGDTVMAGGVGRCDLPTGDSGALEKSLKKIAALTGDFTLHCGHGPDPRLLAERAGNPYFNDSL